MSQKPTVLCVVGTRPEAIKMAPVINGLKAAGWANVHVVATAQHRAMLDQVLALFSIVPDDDLDLMRPNQTLAELTSRVFVAFDAVLARVQPDVVVAQGDTTTVMAAAMSAFYRDIPFAHVEAGLRTFDLRNPFPEELNRVIAGRVARLHFAPTQRSHDHLIAEGVPADHVLITGNTVIDALLTMAERRPTFPYVPQPGRRQILVTVHRRENFGQPLVDICSAIMDILERKPDVEILWPVHPNPNVGKTVREFFSDHPRVTLVEPMDYETFVGALQHAHLILTDSGGVQEEAPALRKPVLVLRRCTERPEAVDVGVAKLVGTNRETVVNETLLLLDDEDVYGTMSRGASPYGDGYSAARIIAALRTLV